jgi:mannose-6-phosphate isomerase-like protein (cupin superfamily)
MNLQLFEIPARRTIDPSAKDHLLIKKSGIENSFDKKKSIAFLPNTIIEKPWGLEYPHLSDETVDIWEMHLFPGHRTSFHCHPGKDVLKIVLEGIVKLKTLDRTEYLRSGDWRLVKGYTAHQTINESNSDGAARIMEIESPPNKHNLIRFKDRYGRQNMPYLTKITQITSISENIIEAHSRLQSRNISKIGKSRIIILSDEKPIYKGNRKSTKVIIHKEKCRKGSKKENFDKLLAFFNFSLVLDGSVKLKSSSSIKEFITGDIFPIHKKKLEVADIKGQLILW